MMLEIIKTYHGCGMNITIAEMQELMPEEIEALFNEHQEMMSKIFDRKS